MDAGAGKQATSRAKQQHVMKIWFAAVVASLLVAVAMGQPPMALKLRRLANASTKQLVAMDELRHTKLGGGAVQLPVSGSGVDYLAGGPYLTRVELGNPPQIVDVLIDTGSSIPWVACQTSGLGARSFNPAASSPRSLGCSDERCQSMVHANFAECNGSRCAYDLNYGTGDSSTSSSTTGYYLLDAVHLDGLSPPPNIVFGCTGSWSGKLAEGAFDGIFGFGPHKMSFVSQLHSLGISRKVFTLCMHSPTGGGLLAFGEAVEPALVYTPLLRSQSYYIVNLEGIAVNGQKLPIDSSVFTSAKNFTFVDSRTTLVFLADAAFEPFVNGIRAATPFASPFIGSNGQICFDTSTSIDLLFPSVELHFAGGARMTLQPHNYLHYVKQSIYCIAWLRNTGRQVTILGDIVLVDKILVHDLENMRFGFADYDCSQPVNVTNSSGKKTILTPIGVPLLIIFYIMLFA